MLSARLTLVVASAFAVHLAACSGNEGAGSMPSGPAAKATPAPPTGSTPPSSPKPDGGVAPAADAGASDPDAGQAPTSLCGPYIGKWLATLDPGAVATGTDTSILGGSVPISGTVDFSLMHDDADLPNILDFTGTATIQAASQTITQTIQPATSPSGDPKDTTCQGNHLNFIGAANVSGVGNVIVNMDGTIDPPRRLVCRSASSS